MRKQQHLHGKLGDAIYECKKRLFGKLKDGVNLDDASALFIAEMRLAFETISRTESDDSQPENVSSESM